jgi:hypothetical protein
MNKKNICKHCGEEIDDPNLYWIRECFRCYYHIEKEEAA